ncbi:hypothetical protein FKM82_001914 [Ascaphus truei]
MGWGSWKDGVSSESFFGPMLQGLLEQSTVLLTTLNKYVYTYILNCIYTICPFTPITPYQALKTPSVLWKNAIAKVYFKKTPCTFRADHQQSE